MKRIGLKQEFHGEPDPFAEELSVDLDGMDEVTLDVVGGCVSFTVASDVPDDQVVSKNLADRHLCCKLKLENGEELCLWINEGAEGVDVRLGSRKKKVQVTAPAKGMAVAV